MWNPVSIVAENMFMPAKELVEFAMSHSDKYHIDITPAGVPWVGTFYVNEMIRDFKAKFTELCARVRTEKIVNNEEKT